MTRQWHRAKDKLAPEGIEVRTLSESGLEQSLWRFGNLWFVDADASSYICYHVIFWREID